MNDFDPFVDFEKHRKFFTGLGCLVLLASAAFSVAIIYVAIHFLLKFW